MRRARRQLPYAHYSHEQSQDNAEASGRIIVRVVPLLYGGMIGVLFDNIVGALAISALISMALDLTMDDKSMFRPLICPLVHRTCPLLVTVSRSLSKILGYLGIPTPIRLHDVRCS